jgi:hypothetical protein
MVLEVNRHGRCKALVMKERRIHREHMGNASTEDQQRFINEVLPN